MVLPYKEIPDILHCQCGKEGPRQREAALEVRTNKLEEVNSAPRVLLKQRDKDKKDNVNGFRKS